MIPEKIAVLMGGVGSEREVSLQSGTNIANVLRSEGINIVEADITPSDLSILDDKSVGVFFLALHGEWGEDGQLQAILESKKLKFTGSGSIASKIAFDKIESKKCFEKVGVQTPFSIEYDPDSDEKEIEEVLSGRTGKFVVKPIAQGSSVGVEIRTGILAAIRAAKSCSQKYGSTMIEEFVSGKELTVGIVNGKPLPIIEIRSESGFYDFNAKYISEETKYLFDTVDDSSLVKRIQEDAVKCFDSVGAKHLSRVDFMLDDNGNYYVLEINTLPGFTSHSLLPKAAIKAGMDQGELCKEIITAALS